MLARGVILVVTVFQARGLAVINVILLRGRVEDGDQLYGHLYPDPIFM